MKISKKIENELWMMLELSGKKSLKVNKKNSTENRTRVIGRQSRVISWLSKFVDPKKIN